MITLLQQHTVDLYHLQDKKYEQLVVPAKSLITVNRFDLFAKMLYIKYRESNPVLALEIYKSHIKAFNPDLKEPGRNDKDGYEDFIKVFDELIDYFQKNEFDENISVIPVSEDGVILDGSHRVAALAYFDKEVSILRFENVQPVADFDYQYFQKRGMSSSLMDLIAFEGLGYVNNMHIACLWPKMGTVSERTYAREAIQQDFDVFYIKDVTINLEHLTKFIYEIYKTQDWVGDEENDFAGARSKAFSCYASNKIVQYVIFQANSLDEVLLLKDKIRAHYQLDKHALHISDDQQETIETAALILTPKVQEFTSTSSRIADKVRDLSKFRKMYWLEFKVKIAGGLKRIGLFR